MHSNNKESIAFDLDGVICNLLPTGFKILKEMYPDKITTNNWATWWEDEYNITSDEIMKAWVECGKRGLFRTAPVYQECKNTLYKLARKYTIFIITWRNYVPNAREDTLYWLDSNRIPYYRLVLTYNKFKVAENENCVFFLDDAPQFCNRVAKTKVPTYLLSRPWNKGKEIDALVKVIPNWYEVRKLLLYR